MFAFLRSLVAGRPRPDPWHTVQSLLAPGAPWSDARAFELSSALHGLARPQLDLPQLGALFEAWYPHHPIEVVWPREYDLIARDPFRVDINDVAVSRDDPTLLPWARLLRSLPVVDGGARVFHHGFTASELLGVLRDPNAPSVEAFRVASMVDWTDGDLHALIDHVAHDATMGRLRHLGLAATGIGPRHLGTLFASGRATQLASLDISERLLDHEDHDVLAALRRMGDLRSLEHLNMYNCLHTAAHVRALVAHEFPRLTHLSLGHADVDAAFVDALCTSDAFPALRAIYVHPCPPALGRWLTDRGIAATVC